MCNMHYAGNTGLLGAMSPLRDEWSPERVAGIEPASSAWKADIISHYTIPAYAVRGYHNTE